VIQEITAQTVGASEQTAASVGKLAAMAVEMRESVEGFKLPPQRAKR
jgi:twitching motility protein PilJ